MRPDISASASQFPIDADRDQSRSPACRQDGPDGGAVTRILVIDDNVSVLEAFGKILVDDTEIVPGLDVFDAPQFSTRPNARGDQPSFVVERVQDGEAGCRSAKSAYAEGRPYAVAFVDMRMPGGWDGLRTIEELWRVDPDIQTVICTAYSDYSWDEIIARLGRSDRLLILRKPFERIEVLQLACALYDKWSLHRERQARMESLEQRVEERTRHLQSALDERQRAEEELDHFFALAPDILCVVGADGRIRRFNPAAHQILGYSPDELRGLSFVDIVHPEHKDEIQGQLQGVAGRGSLRSDHAIRTLNRDGAYRWIEWRFVTVASKSVLYATGRDVTERRALEAKLLQAQKMEAIGQLTGGIAHDFNNLLLVVMGNLELIIDRLAADDGQARELGERALSAAQRGAALTHRLLAFARQQTLEAEPTDLARLIDGMSDLLRRTLGEHIEIATCWVADLWAVAVDRNQLENAVLNLAINSRDAMPKGGKLTIEASNVVLDQDYAAKNLDVQAGEYVMLAVSDSGSGMTPEVMQQAIQPFFTTKEVGKGSGLGLSMIYGFVKQSQGHMKIYSEVGHGTTVKLYFPRSGAEKEPTATVAERSATLPKGSEFILVVEDESDVRSLVVQRLSDLGYQVHAVDDGPSALRFLEAGHRIDLLLTDMVMPGGLSGLHLAKKSWQLRPGLRILLTSGYTNAMTRAEEGFRLLSKPYTNADLARAVRTALDAQRGPSCSAPG